MSAIRTVIVDDEPLSRELIAEYLGAEPDVEIVAQCENGFEAVKAVTRHDPDLLLLDIQMPKLDGFEVLELLDREPIVVFITAHDEFALRAFEAHALDYLLKPVGEDRFRQVMERVRERLHGKTRTPLAPLAADVKKRPLERVLVRMEEGRIEIVPVGKIDYLEAQDDWIVIASGPARLRKQQPLGEIEKELDSRRFVRIHRSYILNLDRLQRVELYAKDSRVAILRDGTKLPLSRSGYGRLRELL